MGDTAKDTDLTGECNDLRAQIAALEAANQKLRTQVSTLSERSRILLQSTREALWDWDLATDEVFYSDRFAELLGLEAGTVTGNLAFWRTRIHPDDRERVLHAVEQHLTADRVLDVEYRLRHENGNYRWFRSRAVVMRDADQKPYRMAGSVGDIHDRKVNERLEHFASRAARIGGWQLNLDPPGLFWNEQTHAIHETDPFTFEPQLDTAINFYTAESRPVISKHVEDCCEFGKSYEVELTIRTAKGKRVPVHVRGLAEYEMGKVARIYGSIQDVSHFRELERQLFQAQKMESIGRLAGGIAHDFNNILTAIRGYADLLIPSFEPGDSRAADVKEVALATNRAGSLTEQLLAFARKQVVSPVEIQVGELVQEMLPLLRQAVSEARDLSVGPMTGKCLVLIDRVQLEQVLLNLVINARDATTQDSEIYINTQEVLAKNDAGEILPHVELSVRDRGEGIAPGTLEHIFEPFFTTKPQGQGSGLGLSTCYGIVKQASGRIEVESRLGLGTTIRVLLPCLGPHQNPGKRP